MTRRQIEAWKQTILDLRCGFEWELANGAREDDVVNAPALRMVLRREAELNALIAEHTT